MTNTAIRTPTAPSKHRTDATPASAHEPEDAIAIPMADHKQWEQLFAEHAKACSVPSRKALIAEICAGPTVLVLIEEERFFAAFSSAVKYQLLVPEATAEHDGIEALIARLEDADPGGEMVEAQVKEEHTGRCPKAKASSMGMVALGSLMAARKCEWMAQAA